MKITKMETYIVPPRWMFLEISTDEGITGWGEPVVEGHAEIVRTAIETFAENLIGKDPLKIEDHWQVMYTGSFYRGGPECMSAIAGIDQALWDIKGKYYGIPVYEMLGGAVRDKIAIYNWVGGFGATDLVNGVKELQKTGCRAVKLLGTMEMGWVDNFKKLQFVSDNIASVREAVGYDIDIGVDFHGRVHKSMAKALGKELDQYHLMFIEEPVLAQNNEALRDIAMNTATPIATGERMFSRWDFKQILKDGYVDIIQPDLSHAGGISEVRKIVTMAEAFDVAAAPHSPLGPIALAACLQIDAVTPNFVIQEQSLGMQYNRPGEDLLDCLADKSVFKFENGYVAVPKGPGLGVEIDKEKVLEMAARGHSYRLPMWRTEDGALAEW